jgi:hypothetical protein
MGNEHTDYDGEIDVPAEAIQVIDPQVVKSLAPLIWLPYSMPAN